MNLNPVSTSSTKAEEIALLEKIQKLARSGSRLASLFSTDLVNWASRKIENDFCPDLYGTLQAHIDESQQKMDEGRKKFGECESRRNKLDARFKMAEEKIANQKATIENQKATIENIIAVLEHRNDDLNQERAENLATIELKEQCWTVKVYSKPFACNKFDMMKRGLRWTFDASIQIYPGDTSSNNEEGTRGWAWAKAKAAVITAHPCPRLEYPLVAYGDVLDTPFGKYRVERGWNEDNVLLIEIPEGE